MNIIYMGTPDFAVPALKKLYESKHTVQAVFTQPDKPKGRKMVLTPPDVKVCAQELNIPVYQPTTFKSEEPLEIIKKYNPDVIVVAAYGKLLPKAVLESAKYGCINIHGSLLPKYRGAAPIQQSVLNGDKVTGVTAMQMAEGLDTGDMLLTEKTAIGDDETASELHDRLSVMGAELLIKTIEAVKSNNITQIKQDESQYTYAPMLTKDICHIDFSETAQKVHNKIRGLSSFPGAIADFNGKRLKIYKSRLSHETYIDKVPGTVVDAKDFTVVCGDERAVSLIEVQFDGGKRMNVSDFLRGNRIENGEVLK